MPSVYLEDGGRLRCQAVRGYWQIFDGMPADRRRHRPHLPHGRARRSSTTSRRSDDYLRGRRLRARRGLRAAARSASRVVGVLNAESPTAPGRRARRRGRALRRAARARGCRSSAGSPPRRAAQQLARTAVRLAALDDAEAIVRETVAAARGARRLRVRDARAARRPRRATTPTTPRARSPSRSARSSAGELAPDRRLGRHRARRATPPPTPAGAASTGHEVLREAGANALSCSRCVAARSATGCCCSPTAPTTGITTEEAELLELLASQAAGSLRMAAAVAELRERAARDPLTGLGHHATFHAELPAARAGDAAAAARARCCSPTSTASRRSTTPAATPPATTCCAPSRGCCARSAPPHGRAFRIGGDEFAMLFECAGEAGRPGGRLAAARAGARAASARRSRSGWRSPPRASRDEQLVARADAAMYEVKRRGRDGVLLAPPQPGTTSA